MNPVPLIDPDASARMSQPRDIVENAAPITGPTRAQCKIAGYTIGQCLGSGGYGEVWRADAPGGLQKAVKFVYGRLDDARAACELEALNRIKEVRHPFLLSLERIEIIEGQLVIVTELADKSLKDRFDEFLAQGSPGIPRDELLLYMSDAAEALDYMCERYSLQHLDVKPENLLLLAGRVKVADFGLVRQVQDKTVTMMGGLTPAYAPPESFRGHPGLFSDQYSLAIVYQEMLTGVLPYPGRTALQLAEQHQNSPPFLSPLPEHDREIIKKALSKEPSFRFSSCRELVAALRNAGLHPNGSFDVVLQDPLHDTNTIAFDTNQRPVTPTPSPGEAQPNEVPKNGPAGSASRTLSDAPAPPSSEDATSSGARSPESHQAGPASMPPMMPGQSPATPQATEPGYAPPRDGSLQPSEVLDAIKGGGTPAPGAPSAADARRSPASRGARPPKKPGLEPILRAEERMAWRPLEPLPPVEVRAEQRLRPTLLIGVGGLAGRVMRRLRSSVATRFGAFDAAPIWRMLVLDTDRNDVTSLTKGADPGVMPFSDILEMPLRHPQDYRNDTSQLLRWLSRRWLYNIPRSLQTEGYRPLGRLAMVDRLTLIRERIEKMTDGALSQEAINTTQGKTSMNVDRDRLRVFVVASVSGGTGGGAVIDVARLTRHLVTTAGHPDAEFIGILMHGTPSDPNRAELALANSCATLAELAQFDAEGRYPGDPACGIPESDGATFDHPYFVHMGDNLDSHAMKASVDAVAEYLYMNVACRASSFFDYCRNPEKHKDDVEPVGEGQEQESDASTPDEKSATPKSEDESGGRATKTKRGLPMLRTFGLRSIGCSHGALPEAAAAILCGELIRRWRGNANLTPAEKPAVNVAALESPSNKPKDDAPPESRTMRMLHGVEEWSESEGLTLERLIARAEACASEGMSRPLKDTCAELLEQVLSKDDVPTALSAIDDALGAIGEGKDEAAADARPLPKPFLNMLAKNAHEFGEAMGEYVLSLANDTNVRVTGAQRITDWLRERAELLSEDVRKEHMRLQTNIQVALNAFTGKQQKRGGLLGILGGARREAKRRWAEVVDCRRRIMLLEGLRKWLHRMKRRIAELNEQLRGMTRELDILIDQFNVTDRWESMAFGLDDEDHLPNAEEELRRLVLETLQGRLPELAANLDNKFRTTYFGDNDGLVDVLEDKRLALPEAAMAAARSAVFGVLEEIDVANLLLPSATLADLPDQLIRCIREAEPHLTNCGGAKRLLLVCPRGTAGRPLRDAIGRDCDEPISIVADAGGDVILCHEFEQLGLDAVIERIAGSRGDCLAAADRLHTRIDVRWRPLTG